MLSRFLETQNEFYVQPRMGVSCIHEMRRRLSILKGSGLPIIGTLTLDSYSRVGQLQELQKAFRNGMPINGFPITLYTPSEIKEEILSLQSDSFFIQVRHGTPQPEALFNHMMECGLHLTEGGPASYCFPYGRIPLRDSIHSWKRACLKLSEARENVHLESFAGCMMGQMGHPTILIALSILEGLFFSQMGIYDISLSYTQGYSLRQDLAAVSALKELAKAYFSPNVKWHVVVYTFMGLYPQTQHGHEAILRESVQLAHQSGAKRLIVKTAEESTKIFQASQIIESVLHLDQDIENCILKGFQKGLLDIPFCLHPDNSKKATTYLDKHGYVCWGHTGSLALPPVKAEKKLTSSELINSLSFNRDRFDKNV
jgi:methylaspartate mutase epsilon subunit